MKRYVNLPLEVKADEKFRRITGVYPKTFTKMVEIFKEAQLT